MTKDKRQRIALDDTDWLKLEVGSTVEIAMLKEAIWTQAENHDREVWKFELHIMVPDEEEHNALHSTKAWESTSGGAYKLQRDFKKVQSLYTAKDGTVLDDLKGVTWEIFRESERVYLVTRVF